MLKLKGLLKKTHNELTEAKKNEVEQNQTISDLQSQLQEEQLRGEEAKVSDCCTVYLQACRGRHTVNGKAGTSVYATIFCHITLSATIWCDLLELDFKHASSVCTALSCSVV